MQVHEKIRAKRRSKGLAQEDMADKLAMSVNGYGDIERGLSDIKLTRLEQIADLLDVELPELFEDGSKNTLNMMGEHSTGTVHNHGVINTLSPEYSELKLELEKQKLICSNKDREIEMKIQEINYLKDIIEVFKNAGWQQA
jgi:transcriptional regulator with XRE-family HTH domain